MPFETGKEKTGGRQPGVKNKNTMLLETFAQNVIEGGMERFQAELDKLTGRCYVSAYMALFEFVKPKLARTEYKEVHTPGPDIDLSQCTKEELITYMEGYMRGQPPMICKVDNEATKKAVENT